VVEDQVVLREFIARLVQDMAFVELIGETGDGQEAYRMAMKLKPSMLILDIMLPGLNGVDVFRRLKSALPNLKVLAFSAFPNRKVMRQMIEVGAHGLVQKSESLGILEQAIERVASGQTYYSPAISASLRDMMLNPEKAQAVNELSDREREVLQMIASSCSNKEIADKLHISVKTAETHRTHIIRKLDIHDTAGLTRFAIANGLIEPDFGQQ